VKTFTGNRHSGESRKFSFIRRRLNLDPSFRWGDESGMAGSTPRMTALIVVPAKA
jgi:hypothetical protein